MIGVAKITVNTARPSGLSLGAGRNARAPSRIAGFSTKYQLSDASPERDAP